MSFLIIDAGNSRIKAAFSQGHILDKKLSSFYTKEANWTDMSCCWQKEIDCPPDKTRVCICSVRPAENSALEEALTSAGFQTPCFLTFQDFDTISIEYQSPQNLGIDRLAACQGARKAFSGINLVVADCGTALTVDCLDKNGHFLGGVIAPGPGSCAESLGHKAEQLFNAGVEKTKSVLQKTTSGCLQAGLYYGYLGLIKELTGRLAVEAFGNQSYLIIGSGKGLLPFLDDFSLNDYRKDLVLEGSLEAAKNITWEKKS